MTPSKIQRDSEMKKSEASIWVLIEFLVSAALALIFHFALHQPVVAYVIFGTGVLITLATYIIVERILTEIKESDRIKQLFSNIKDACFIEAAHKIIRECEHKLEELTKGKMKVRADELSLWEISALRKAKKRACAVCLLHPDEWDKQGWKNYLDENKKAVERGLQFSRILLLEKGAIKDTKKKAVIEHHIQTGADIMVVWIDETPRELQRDFVIIDDKECFISEMIGTTKIIGGVITTNKDDIREYLDVFERLQVKAISANQVLLDSQKKKLELDLKKQN